MYQKALVTFIDILGFRDIVERENPDKVQQVLLMLGEFNKDGDIPNQYAFRFSDSVVRVTIIEAHRTLGDAIYYELNDLTLIQAGMITSENILLRGGIAYGDIYVEKNMIFGKGLIRAYDLESSFANYPRIILAPELVQELMLNPVSIPERHSKAEYLDYIEPMVAVGDDGVWYVNYINSILTNEDYSEMALSFPEMHRDLIIKDSSGLSDLDGRLAKYIWLANYHNRNVPEEFLIKSDEVRHHHLPTSDG